ncbi:hypothetical protein LTR37_008600 [Vermiconidia calcicola]|uniref:Uncharacterized protein n=1 Tax=Vermiconidia calcicola TaxID=1690605 RepID=A0ACC3NBG5_9PEZI|nr:hypothetical protein LTR37_008600 [Vermiconidia calcicola]
MKHRVVVVDNWVTPPALSIDHEQTSYASTSAAELPERIKDATIIVTSGTPIIRTAIEKASNLQLISCNGTGTDHIDKDAARERGVAVSRVPAQNTDSVSEHAFALYYTIRRRIVDMHAVAMDGKTWAANGQLAPKMGKPPRTNAEETLVVIGYGALGQNIERIGKALGMTVLLAERKGASHVREGRISFADVINFGTILMLTTPLDDSTRDMISTAELQTMDPTALLVNVGRGGVINEAALAQALKDGQIGGAATDVFEHEPATTENCPLLDPSIPNLILSPHVAWYSNRTIQGTVATVKANIEGFVAGRPRNIVVAGRSAAQA